MKNIALILPLLSGVMFGAVGLFVRSLTEYGMSNPTVLFVRTLFASIILLIYLLVFKRGLFRIEIRDILLFCGTGIFGVMGLNLCYNFAVNNLSLSLAAVLLCTSPVFVVIFASILFKEKISGQKLLCIALVITGCVFASGLIGSNDTTHLSVAGVLFGIASALFYALYSLFSRKATDKGYHTYTIIFYSMLLITIVLLPMADLEIIREYMLENPLENIAYLCLHSLCTSVLPYIFITMALLYAEVGKVSILAAGMEPVAAAIFGILFYKETPTILMLVGMVTTIIAITLLCTNKEKE